MVTVSIYDCGCVITRPKEQSCRSYGTRWRVYIAINKGDVAGKIMLKCRDCGRMRHFVLTGVNPVMIQYQKLEEIDLGGVENG